MTSTQKRLVAFILPFFGILLTLGIVHEVREIRESGRAKVTETNMQRLNEVLRSAQVTNVGSSGYLRRLFLKEGYPDYTRDGWGRDILVKVFVDPKGLKHYTLRSLGRDGKMSSCCTGRVRGEWDKDALWADNRWLQAW